MAELTSEALRTLARERRDALSAEARSDMDRRIRERLFSEESWQRAEKVLMYLSFGSETDTWEIARRARSEGKRIYCPRVIDRAGGRMEFFLTDLEDTKAGPFGIREPVGDDRWQGGTDGNEVSLILVPGLAFGKGGERIGYGGGYYDRYLSAYRELKERLALCYDCQVIGEEILSGGSFPVKETDEAVDLILTEDRRIECAEP